MLVHTSRLCAGFYAAVGLIIFGSCYWKAINSLFDEWWRIALWLILAVCGLLLFAFGFDVLLD